MLKNGFLSLIFLFSIESCLGQILADTFYNNYFDMFEEYNYFYTFAKDSTYTYFSRDYRCTGDMKILKVKGRYYIDSDQKSLTLRSDTIIIKEYNKYKFDTFTHYSNNISSLHDFGFDKNMFFVDEYKNHKILLEDYTSSVLSVANELNKVDTAIIHPSFSFYSNKRNKIREFDIVFDKTLKSFLPDNISDFILDQPIQCNATNSVVEKFPFYNCSRYDDIGQYIMFKVDKGALDGLKPGMILYPTNGTLKRNNYNVFKFNLEIVGPSESIGFVNKFDVVNLNIPTSFSTKEFLTKE